MTSTANLSIGNRLDWVVFFSDTIRVVDQHARKVVGINVTQCRILFHLTLFPRIPIGSIGSSLSLKASTTTAAIDSLEKKGFVRRITNENDKRSVRLVLTEEGKRTAGASANCFAELFNSSIRHLKEDFHPFVSKILLSDIKHLVFSGESSKIDLSAVIISYCDNLTPEDVSSFLSLGRMIENMCYFCCKLSAYDHARMMTPNDSKMLRYLGNIHPESTILRDISANIGTKPNVTTVSVKSLDKKGYIQRSASNLDKRSTNITLTKKGIEYLAEHNEGFIRLFDLYFPELTNHSPKELAY